MYYFVDINFALTNNNFLSIVDFFQSLWREFSHNLKRATEKMRDTKKIGLFTIFRHTFLLRSHKTATTLASHEGKCVRQNFPDNSTRKSSKNIIFQMTASVDVCVYNDRDAKIVFEEFSQKIS